MRKLFEGTEELAVTFCERCGEVCNAGCRRAAALCERALLQQLWLRVRV